MPGCCTSDSPRSYDMCSAIDESNHCDRMIGCHWLQTEDESDCELVTTTDTPPMPGCCYVTDASYVGSRWEEICQNLFTESLCLQPKEDDGDARCGWTSMPDG